MIEVSTKAMLGLHVIRGRNACFTLREDSYSMQEIYAYIWAQLWMMTSSRQKLCMAMAAFLVLSG